MITKNFDVSTRHISQIDNEIIQGSIPEEEGIFANPPTDLIVYPYEGGCFVFAAIEDDVAEDFYTTLENQGLSKEFIALLRRAKQSGCKYLQLDRDGDTYNDLPTFEW